MSIKRFIPLVVIILFIALAWSMGVVDYINLDVIKERRGELLEMVAQHPYLSAGVFMLTYILSVALSLPIATVLTLLGGFLFGVWLGAGMIAVSATIGASISFFIAKSAIGETLRQKAGPLYQKISKNMEENVIGYMLFMRLVPIFPFFLVNIVPALFNVRFLPYVVTTFFGILPGTFVYANVGRELGSIESLKDLVSTNTIFAFCLLGLFSLIPTLYKQFKKVKSHE